MVAETLVPVEGLQRTRVVLTHGKRHLIGDLPAFCNDLLRELRIRGKRDVLLLHRGVNETGTVAFVIVIIVAVIDGDALFQNQLDSLLADPIPEVHEFARLAWRHY